MTTLSKFIRLFNPVVLIAIAAFLIPVIIIEVYVLKHTNGTFSYALDDTFIHMAIAKNLAFKGVWGTNHYEFASASSSVLYPLILAAAFFVFGAQPAIPFIINVLAAIALIIALQQWLQRQSISRNWQIIILLAVIYLTPLPVLVISGMEHTLQVLFCFLFLTHFTDEMAKNANNGRDSFATLATSGNSENIPGSKNDNDWDFPTKVYLYGALMVASRYECMTLVGIACVIVLTNRKYWLAFQLGLISMSPIIVFGIISLFKGSYFIPNSVLLKSETPPLTFDGLFNFFTNDFFWRLVDSRVGYNTIATQRLLFILPVVLLLFWKQVRQVRSYYYFLIILITAVIFHLSFAATAKFPRFEAYLIGSTVIITGVLLAKYGQDLLPQVKKQSQWIVLGMSILLTFPLLMRGINSFSEIGRSCINIYEQQYQMGRFVHSHYYRQPIAVNDLGAISFLSSARNLDLIGLGSIDVARSRKNGYWGTVFLDTLSKEHNVSIAIIYDFWFPATLLQRWSKVASWQIPDNVMCASDQVSFYAVDTAAKTALVKNLHEFQSSLPADVSVQYY